MCNKREAMSVFITELQHILTLLPTYAIQNNNLGSILWDKVLQLYSILIVLAFERNLAV